MNAYLDYRPGYEGIWRYRKLVTLPNGNKIRIQGTPATNTKAAAEAAERAHIDRLMHPERVIAAATPEPEPSGKRTPTIAELIKRYADQKEGTPGSIETRKIHLEGPIREYFGSLPADGVRQSHLNAFRDAHKQAAQTIRNKLYALLTLLRWAADDEVIENHNLQVRVKERHAKGANVIHAVAPADVTKLIAAAKDPRYVIAILLACEAGLRIGEIVGAQWTDFDRDARTIRVRRSIDAKNNLGPPKNGCERTVDLSPAIMRALGKVPKRGIWLLTRNEDDAAARKNVKRASPPGGHMGRSGLNKAIRAVYRRAGVVFGRSTVGINVWHSMRHTYGSRLVAGGASMEHVRLLMGHADVRTTQRYITTTREQLATVMRGVFG